MAEGKVDLSDEGLVYLTAEEEEAKIIAQGNAPLNDDGTFVRDKVNPVRMPTIRWFLLPRWN